jgi:NAD(P)-dependent dehydrogenase (short-subunit alcohol dehydrogenase family)
MDLGLKGKVALVTGAGSQRGFGKGIVLVLAQEGCDIIATDKDLEGAKQTAAEVEALGRKAIALKADVTNFKEVKDMVKAGLEKFGRIDILVNNAGVGSGLTPFAKMTEAEWDQDINILLKGTMYCTHAVLPQMLERKGGKIINISTAAALDGTPAGIMYGTAKAAVIFFSKGLAQDVGHSGINVNVIGPGGGDTGFYIASGAPPKVLEHMKEAAAAGMTTTPEDIGNTVAFLASDVAKKLHGQFIQVMGPVSSHFAALAED